MRALFYVRTNFPQIFWQQIPTLLVISHYSTLVWNLHFFFAEEFANATICPFSQSIGLALKCDESLPFSR